MEEEAILSQERQDNRIIPGSEFISTSNEMIQAINQGAELGATPTFEEALTKVYAPSEGFKIEVTQTLDSPKKITPEDVNAAIVAGLCGVTKTCADKCCSIGEKALENAGNNPIAVRLELVRTLQQENPDFFNQPNADKLITEQVKEIMTKKRNAEAPPTISSEKDSKLASEPTEQKKPKVELPWNKKLTLEEEKKKMEALSGTYSQGIKTEVAHSEHSNKTQISEKKAEPTLQQTTSEIKNEKIIVNGSESSEIKSEQPIAAEPAVTIKPTTETPATIIEKPQEQKPKNPDHAKEMMQPNNSKPVERPISNSQSTTEQTVMIPQSEVQPIRQEFITPAISQQRIERHRSKSEPSKPQIEQTVTQPPSEKQKEVQLKTSVTENLQPIETPVTQSVISKSESQTEREKSQPISLTEPKIAYTNTTVEQTLSILLQQETVVDSQKTAITSPFEHKVHPQTATQKPINSATNHDFGLQQDPKVMRLDSDMPIPLTESTTDEIREPQKPKIGNTQLNESVIQIPVEVMVQSPSQKQEFQQIEHPIQKPDVMQPHVQEVTIHRTEQTIQIPKLEIPQIESKDFIPELTTIRFTSDNLVVLENTPAQSTDIAPQISHKISVSEQIIQQNDTVLSEPSVIKTDTTPETNSVVDTVHVEIPTAQIKIDLVKKPQIDIQGTQQRVSIDMQQVEIPIINYSDQKEDSEIQTTESTSVGEQIQTEISEKPIEVKPSTESSIEKAEITVEPVTADTLEQLLTELITEKSEAELIEIQEYQAESEVIEVQKIILDEEVFMEDHQVVVADTVVGNYETEQVQSELLVETENLHTKQVPEVSTETLELLDSSIAEESSVPEFVLEPTIISVQATQEELPHIITETLSESEFETEPILILAILENNENLEIVEEISELESSEEVVKDTTEIQKMPQSETVVLQFLNQEQVFNFMNVIQDISDLVSFLHEQNQQDDSVIDIYNSKEMNVTKEELKNDTFGQYDDTVIMMLWPLVQFILFIQGMQIFIPPKGHPELISGSMSLTN